MHQPVLYQEIIHAIRPKRDRRYLDGTLGAGGHAYGLLEASAPAGRLLGLDVDPDAITLARHYLSPFENRVWIVRSSYTALRREMQALGWMTVDGIVLDLGVSSMQLDRAARGFSFREDAPLDMRFDPEQVLTAAEIVNDWSEKALADILHRFGEERRARQVARAIVQARPVRTTLQLAALVAKVTRGGRIHPATRTFQALRIATNRELESLLEVLPQAVEALAPEGRLAVISFHSLEDRIVKQFFRRESQDCLCPPEQPVCTCGHQAAIRRVNRKPIQASEEEVAQNPRARSARLRVAEKLST